MTNNSDKTAAGGQTAGTGGAQPPDRPADRPADRPEDPKLRATFGLVDQSSRAFDEVRRLVEHEDGLVDKRIGWMLAFNGFLFAAYGLSLGAEISLTEMVQTQPQGAYCVAGNCVESVGALGRRIETLRASLVIAGCLSALAALAGVWAAMRAMAYVRHDYGRYLADRQDLGSVVPAFPSVGAAALLGNAYGLAMPCLVSVPWLYVWSKGYAGTLPWADRIDDYAVAIWGPGLAFAIMTLLLRRSPAHPDAAITRHKK